LNFIKSDSGDDDSDNHDDDSDDHDDHDDDDDDDDDDGPHQELSVHKRQRLFFIFPRLKRLTWMEESTPTSAIVFTREANN